MTRQPDSCKSGGERFRVGEHLFLIRDEFRRGGVAETDGLRRDDVHERSALGAGEHDFVDIGSEFRFAKNHAAARAAEGFVGGRGDDIGPIARVGMHTGGDQAGEVGHVDQENGADRIGHLTEAGEIDDARIGAAAGDDHFRLVFLGQARELVVIDTLIFFADAIGDHFIELAGKIQVMAVREMAAVRQVHTEDGVARIEHAAVGGFIGLRSAVRLDVGVFSVE